MAADPDSKSGAGPEAEVEVNNMFEKHTIEEIRDIEKKTRSNIERKKEDLRMMVGERYRDLIAAADTITEMKNSSQHVMRGIGNIEQLCKTLKQNYMVKGISSSNKTKPELRKKKQEETQFYGVASQIKLLLDMPEKIWSAADGKDYLRATRLYLLSRHINTSLHLDSQQSSTMLAWFPVLSRQWAAISHFKTTILQGCRQLLKQADTSDQMIAEALCSTMLLEDSTPRQVFNEFLLARTAAVQQIFSQHNASIKEQICTVVQLISTTVHQIHAVFYCVESDPKSDQVPSNLLLETLDAVTSTSTGESRLLDLQSSISSKCLPKTVTDFHPSLRALSTPVAEQQLHNNCEQWVNTCVNDVKAGVSKLLNFVNTVKRLADIRDCVWEIQKQDERLSTWDLICTRVLRRTVSIWEVFLRPLFLDRIKALGQYQLESTTELTKRQLAKVVLEIADKDNKTMLQEQDLSSYIWRETTGDIPADTAWIPANSKTLTEGGGLMMKSRAFTPVLQSLCKRYDEKLKVLLEDNKHYLQVDGQTDVDIGPFDRFRDDAHILVHVKTATETSSHQLVEYMRQQLTSWKTGLEQIDVREIKQITCDKVLLIGRFSTAICELTSHLKQCILGPSNKEAQRVQKKPMFTRSSSKSPDDPSWMQVKALFSSLSLEAFRIWSVTTSSSLVDQFSESLNSADSRDVIIACTRWDEIDIQEETEEGKSVKSIIRVPMQASWHLQGVLCDLCQEINRVGGHAINRSILQEIVNQTSDGIIGSFEKLMASAKSSKRKEGCLPFTQQRALQSLFDVKYLLHIIPRKDEGKEHQNYQKRAQKIVFALEEFIDPFDMDVFSPYIQSHLSKQSQRSAVLLGALTTLDKHGMFMMGRQPPSSHQEQHNVLPLVSSSNRFPLLPLSSSSSSTRANYGSAIVPQPLAKLPLDIGQSLTPMVATALPQQATDKSSFYNKLGNMSQIWFSNIGGKT